MKKELFILAILLANAVVYADVGVGVSPSKTVLQVEGGKVQELNLLVFNTGDDPLEITMSVEGTIGAFTTIEPKKLLIEPEPKPHSLPIKNGKEVKVRIKPPGTSEPVNYSGNVGATGTVATDQQFGGSVGVATLVELQVTPSKSIFAFITTTQWIIIAGVILLLILILVLRKMGLKLKFEK